LDGLWVVGAISTALCIVMTVSYTGKQQGDLCQQRHHVRSWLVQHVEKTCSYSSIVAKCSEIMKAPEVQYWAPGFEMPQ